MFGAWAMRGLGGLLLLAAGLKMYGLAVEPVGRAGLFSEPWLQTLIVEWEIALGIWLISGVNRWLAWVAATATFLTFTGFSFWQGLVGQASCGCLGAIQINPWLAFCIDLLALGLLAGGRHQRLPMPIQGQFASALRRLAMGTGGVLATLGIFAAIGTLVFGSPAASLAYLRGERLSADPSLVDLGDGYVGETKKTVVHLHNWSDRPIRVIGGTSDCSCIVTLDLPVTLAPGEVRSLTVGVTFVGPPGQFTRVARFLTDHERTRIVSFRLTGTGLPSLGEPASSAN